ncbi:MAG: lipoate--protein ligase family protein, partial [Chloroflexi bacterium]|nr:lipoate--protein ligase family protein [Chloroflexota bacterium]
TDGAMNMAIDEAIISSVTRGESLPTLRFFDWSPPCLSLGHAQVIEDVDLDRLESFGYGIVRRPTGGKAILHIDEITYSVVTRQDDSRVEGGIVESYRRLSEGLMRGLGLMDLLVTTSPPSPPPLMRTPASGEGVGGEVICFEVPSNYEITVIGKKLIGSAQARKRGIVLQHGSLPLTGDIARICDVLKFENDEAREKGKDRLRSRAITLEGALMQVVPYQTAAQALTQGFKEKLNLELVEGELTKKEMGEAREIKEEKYEQAWN